MTPPITMHFYIRGAEPVIYVNTFDVWEKLGHFNCNNYKEWIKNTIGKLGFIPTEYLARNVAKLDASNAIVIQKQYLLSPAETVRLLGFCARHLPLDKEKAYFDILNYLTNTDIALTKLKLHFLTPSPPSKLTLVKWKDEG
jgi:hypothetical protein